MLSLIISFLALLQRSNGFGLLRMRNPRLLAFQLPRYRLEPALIEPCTWFHAASLGELEMLRPLIEDFHALGFKVGVTAFSDSALSGLDAIRPIAVFAGLSPPETEWGALFQHFNVTKLIVAKYDLWPGLLRAASERHCPVLVINAQARKSFRILRMLFAFSFSSLPRLFLFVNVKAQAEALHTRFKKIAQVFEAPDPRWERVKRRKSGFVSNPKLVSWIDRLATLPGPVGMVGSAWLSDLQVILPAWRSMGSHSLVVVPHDLSPGNLEKIRECLRKENGQGRILLVEEMGILTELYQMADWVFVGGGYESGVHSLIEPASYAIPLACGPARVKEFPEARLLIASGQLRICLGSGQVQAFLQAQSENKIEFTPQSETSSAYQALLEECVRIQ